MRTIDADYLIDVITKWKNSLSDQKEKKVLEEVIHCINAKETVVDINKLIQSINYEKLNPQDFVDSQDIKDATIYNGALDNVLDRVKLSINPTLVNQFDFDKGSYFNKDDNSSDYEKED